MNCFVASAFEHRDVDDIYDHAIRPILKELNLHPSRVDRVEHNDDIDDRIFKLIEQSNVCIADLTFARPSVYYEAGYAHGIGKPVIYIARGDHFRARESDEAGNLRVHFDLQMKNIIPWTTPNDSFKNRLRKRLRHVLRPLLKSREKEIIKSKDRERFASLSQDEKLSSLIVKGQALLRRYGFRKAIESEINILRHNRHYVHLCQEIRNEYLQIKLFAFPTINKTNMRDLFWYWYRQEILRNNDKIVRAIKKLYVVAALRTSREQSLADLLPDWTRLAKGMYTKKIHTHPSEPIEIETIVFIDGILAQDDFTNHLRPMINRIIGSQLGKPSGN
jgi:hypothetical protein